MKKSPLGFLPATAVFALALIIFPQALPAADPLPGPAAPSPAPSADAEQMLQELLKIESERDAMMKRGWTAAAAAVTAGAQSKESAIDLYEAAVRQTQFAGLSRESTQWRDWKDGEGSVVRSTPGGKALLLSLQYMKLTMRRAFGEELPSMLSDVIAYVAVLQNEIGDITPDRSAREAVERAQRVGDEKRARSLREELKQRQTAKQILDGQATAVIAKYLGIDGELAKAEGWPQKGGDLKSILDKVVLPELRAAKDPRLFNFWEDKMTRSAEEALDLGQDFEKAKYANIEFPALIWARAEDYLLFGDRNRAMTEMLSAIRRNPTHSQADAWIGKLRVLLNGGTADPAAGGGEATPSSDEAAPPEPPAGG